MSSSTQLQETNPQQDLVAPDLAAQHLAAPHLAAPHLAAPLAKTGSLSPGTIVLLLGLIAIAVVFGVALARQQQMQPTSGLAPDFSFVTFDSQTMELSDFRGKVVVINFWASWCVPCADEAPELEATWRQYQPRGDVVFLGIAYADNGPRSVEFIERYGISYLNAPDLGTRISEDYNIRGVPETFIINQEGEIVEFIYAGVTQRQLSAIIDRVLGLG